MIQGTNPTHTFLVNIDVTKINKVRISYEQHGKIVVVKEKGDCILQCIDDVNQIATYLSQAETMKFDAPGIARIQMHALTNNGDALVSNPVAEPVHILLNKVVL